ncbi:hypothetical protein [Duganella sp. FT27W]|uniref:hypothetical protein n=1 Tax=Duganella sp. FT27W TaxID=2654636 RepID=UPI00128B6338|nr:hypothetical protein [Duganella sp. FT27W]MPQ56300.1 hypothetical protein [Duganella sp. FT27W]
MFRPNQHCRIQLSSGKHDIHGQPIPGRYVPERCSVVKLATSNEKTTVRADSSASRGNAQELETTSIILLPANTLAKIDDIIQVAAIKLRIATREPKYDVTGRLDHYRIQATMWSQK